MAALARIGAVIWAKHRRAWDNPAERSEGRKFLARPRAAQSKNSRGAASMGMPAALGAAWLNERIG